MLLEEILHLKAKVLSIAYALDNHRDGAGDARKVFFHGNVVGGGKVIGACSGICLLDGKGVPAFLLDHPHHANGGGTALGITKEDDLVTEGFTADMLKVRLNGKSHVHNGPCSALYVHIGVDAVLCYAKAYVIGNHNCITLCCEDSLKREGFRRAFGV